MYILLLVVVVAVVVFCNESQSDISEYSSLYSKNQRAPLLSKMF